MKYFKIILDVGLILGTILTGVVWIIFAGLFVPGLGAMGYSSENIPIFTGIIAPMIISPILLLFYIFSIYVLIKDIIAGVKGISYNTPSKNVVFILLPIVLIVITYMFFS